MAISDTPFHAVELTKRMAANAAVHHAVDAFRELLKMGKFHSNVEPIQHVLSVWHNLPLNGPQTGIAIEEE